MQTTLTELAQLINGVVIGDGSVLISSLSPIDDIAPHSLIFAEGADNVKRAQQSIAAAVLVATPHADMTKPMIQVDHPFNAFIQLMSYFYPPIEPTPGIHPSAVIAEDVMLGADVTIGPYVTVCSGSIIGDRCVIKSHVHVGHHVHIGHDSILHPHVTLYDHCQLGERVCIHASSVIGSDGFGFTLHAGQHAKVPHVGRVIIHNDVEIGANTVIDRATIGATVIGEGTKIDNLVQVAHSVKLGQHNILCAFTGIAGSTVSGNHVVFAANVGVSDHVRIDDGVILGARAGVPPKKHLRQGNVYLGNPARPKDKAIEHELATTRIPIMRKNLKRLSEKVNALIEHMQLTDKAE